MLRLLENNPWLNLVFLVLAVASVLVSVALSLASRREMQPVFNKKSFTLIRSSVSRLKGLKITFMGSEVVNLTTTRIAIWNKGKATINKGDVAPLDPIRIEVEGEKAIIHAKIIHRSNQVNNFAIRPDGKKVVYVDFDYFHKSEGVMIQIYHTGSSGEEIKILGTIKGVGGCKSAVVPEFYLVDKYLRPLLSPTLTTIRKKSRILAMIVIFLLMPIIIVPFAILSGIDATRRLFSTIPKDLNLEN